MLSGAGSVLLAKLKHDLTKNDDRLAIYILIINQILTFGKLTEFGVYVRRSCD